MNLLFVTNAYPPDFTGGAELVAHSHALRLTALGYSCTVLTGDRSGGTPALEVSSGIHEGIVVHKVGLHDREYSWRFENFRNAYVDHAFTNLVSSIQPDVVHFHNLPGLSVDLIPMAKARSCATILTVHDHWGFCHRQTLTKPNGSICQDYSACKKCLKHFTGRDGAQHPIDTRNLYIKQRLRELDLMLSPSEYLATEYRNAGAAPKHLRVLSNGVDLGAFFTPPHRDTDDSQNTIFGLACYLGDHKGIKQTLKAISRLPRNCKAQFIFAGKGPLEANIRRYMNWGRNRHMVRFVGAVSPDAMRNFYDQLDVFVCASIWPENQPQTIMEAMACGLPVIATNYGGIPELVVDGQTGQLVRPNDAQALAAAILNYASGPSKALTQSIKARRAIEKHDSRFTIAALISIYKSLVSRRQ
jgi:glycosyltransferase involved in cell wall biosynthesis